MEFWGIEVKAGGPLKVRPDDYSIIHLSQAALGESKVEKGNESATLFVKVNGKKIVLGTLSYENIPQLSFDLVFEKEVELSHNLKFGSVYFCGYQSALPDSDDEEDMYSDDSEDEPVPLVNADNVTVQLNANAKPATAKSNVAKPDSSSKQKAKPVLPSKDSKADTESDDDDDSDDDNEDDEEDESDEDESEEGMSVDADSDNENDSESEDEETPKKAEKGTKRPNDSAAKTPVSSKKQKSATPQKTDGKKGGHTATPHPAKGTAKASANGNNTKPQTPKSGGKFTCNSCDRSFGSEPALQSHSKAKHGK